MVKHQRVKYLIVKVNCYTYCMSAQSWKPHFQYTGVNGFRQDASATMILLFVLEVSISGV